MQQLCLERKEGEPMDAISLFSNKNRVNGSQRKPGWSYKVVENNFKHRKKSDFYCDHCGIRGHTIERCWKVYVYQSNSTGRSRMGGNQNASGVFNTATNAVKYEEQQGQEKYSYPGMTNGNETCLKLSIMFTHNKYE